MTWNYRIIKQKYDKGLYGDECETYTIRECFYKNRRSKTPRSVTIEPCYPMGETIEGLKEDLNLMMEALNQPVLDYEKDFKK